MVCQPAACWAGDKVALSVELLVGLRVASKAAKRVALSVER